MKLWEKNVQVTEEIDRFTVGNDRELDLYLAPYDVIGSMAHITMLESDLISHFLILDLKQFETHQHLQHN